MEDLVRYLDEIVDPTVAEFERNSTSVRHAFITCVVVFHAVDYRAHPKRSTGLRQEYRTKSDAFALVDMVAHAFKHVRTERRDVPNLRAASVISRPPAVAGVLRTGLSLVGDTTGAVTLANNPSISLLDSRSCKAGRPFFAGANSRGTLTGSFARREPIWLVRRASPDQKPPPTPRPHPEERCAALRLEG